MTGKPRHIWTEDQVEIVRRDYELTHRSSADIAARLGLTPAVVRHQIYRMGLARRSDRRPWSREEDDRLRELLELYPASRVANRMNRTVNSVVVRSKRLGIKRRSRAGWYTKAEVGEILGVDHHWLQRRIDSGALVATYHNGRRPQNRQGLVMWHVARAALRRFIRRYPEELNGRNLDVVQVVDILAGVQEVT